MDALARAVSAVSLLIARCAVPMMVILGAWLVPGRSLRVGPDADLKEFVALLFFALVMGSLGFGYLCGAHVRIDLVSRRFSERLRAAIELGGCVAVLLPLCAILMWYGGEAAWRSFLQGERLAVGDLPLQWLVRLMVPCGALLLLAAAATVSMRCMRTLRAPREKG